jgi:hypothetical protein
MSTYVRFQVLTVTSMKFKVLWDVLPYSQVDVDRRFRVVMEAVCTSEMSVDIYLTTRQYILEGSNLLRRRNCHSCFPCGKHLHRILEFVIVSHSLLCSA